MRIVDVLAIESVVQLIQVTAIFCVWGPTAMQGTDHFLIWPMNLLIIIEINDAEFGFQL